ncbi:MULTISPECIES: MaoC/PaaZ C-terminal domain-containing protein [unclassified Duganella]|uniref:MaoC/PaaZ C-terminal domain-containing protein n=1 Tax=unclassified Duganella TaxID=2636909 RepID=UPI000E34738B|nr:MULTISPECIES: MaoC/PaaZ C-terminal domain-containing protein [unclassified Duganella]RFP18826.1 hypothetical protein D0T23_03300 [Duganella sp. BJB475]RFP35491.1 hypothetical protein D0T21_03300 [Duganella sp. BJB476]
MTAADAIPYGLLRHQGAMLRATARLLLQAAGRTLLAPQAPRTPDAPLDTPPDAPSLQTHSTAPLQRRIAAPPAQLVEHYIRWCGAAGRYDGQLPPHMVSQWSLPLVSELLMQLPYRLTGIINQGVAMAVHGPLPRDTPLTLSAAVEQVAHADGWARIIVAVVTGTAQQARLVETRLHMRVRLPGARAARSAPARPPDPAWLTAGTWRADASDGLRFSLLTGDFNPIHWCGPLARRSIFGAKVLHGFGSLARSYETLAPGSFRELDVRFLRPVTLPGQALSVQLASEADADGWRALRLAGGDDMIHLAGRLR